MLNKIHDGLFEILCFYDDLCRKLNLKYYLAYGTLLGAVRHEGFIPWDDDVDIWMPRKDFMKLIEYLRDNPDDRFVINEGKYKLDGDRPSEFQIKILDTQNRITRQYAGRIEKSYLWIDIFSLDSFPQSKKDWFFNTFKNKLFVYKIARCKTFLIDNGSFFSKMNKIIYKLHTKYNLFKYVLNEEKCLKKAVSHITRYEEKLDSEYVEYFCYAAVYLPKREKCFFKKEWFEEGVKVDFRGRLFYAPKNYHQILKLLYNDYMKLPPLNERIHHKSELIE